jgi:NAD+ kinase
MSLRAITVFTHGRPEETSGALGELAAMAAADGAVLTLDADESAKHPVRGEIEGLALDTPPARDAELCVALGGDGTILRALRAYARTSVPVFAVNFGEVGFLSTVEPERMREGFARALAGTLDVLSLPAIEVEGPAGTHVALNDLSLHRKVGGRVAELSYAIGEEEVGSVRCDGLVVATPQAGHARRLDRLQPGQRRPGDGLGRGRHGRVLHRSALAQRPRPRGRARRRADAAQQLARDAVGLRRRAPGR